MGPLQYLRAKLFVVSFHVFDLVAGETLNVHISGFVCVCFFFFFFLFQIIRESRHLISIRACLLSNPEAKMLVLLSGL